MTDSLDNDQDIIDSRDVIARIAELMPFRIDRKGTDDVDIAEFKTREEAEQFLKDEDYDPEIMVITEIDEEAIELSQLKNLAEQGRNLEDWEYGVTLVRDSYFEEYAKQYAEDLGLLPSEPSWPLAFIAWDEAADALKEDYEELDFSGVVYWAR